MLGSNEFSNPYRRFFFDIRNHQNLEILSGAQLRIFNNFQAKLTAQIFEFRAGFEKR